MEVEPEDLGLNKIDAREEANLKHRLVEGRRWKFRVRSSRLAVPVDLLRACVFTESIRVVANFHELFPRANRWDRYNEPLFVTRAM
jgi:hypothetical protein